ncbi:unnamed protein product [Prorocentrum cordatum]|uniref:Tubulin--tyrosine ligase-like protein 5 n=1 Tax=Prorocentrum cordatum TaxID=2364126 RepID=A0ABN9XLZ5_9DINO|nr:unnamed protein product [Polarella glacialis]
MPSAQRGLRLLWRPLRLAARWRGRRAPRGRSRCWPCCSRRQGPLRASLPRSPRPPARPPAAPRGPPARASAPRTAPRQSWCLRCGCACGSTRAPRAAGTPTAASSRWPRFGRAASAWWRTTAGTCCGRTSGMHKVLDGMALPPRTGGRDRLASQCGYFMAAGQKCRLARHVAAVRAALGGSVEGRHPPTYELKNQTQFNAWRAAAQSDLGLHWIVKPCAAGRSAGIRLLSGSEVAGIAEPAWDSWDVAQAYLDPYMGFGGRKFHLRLYLLVTRWSPAGALLYDSGLVLRSRRAYTEGRRSDEDIFSAISDDVEPLALAALWGQIGGEAAGRVWSEIGALFAELLGHRLAESFGDPRRLLERPYGCFDLFGADVLLDAGLRPFLLEVNMGPNLYVEGRGAYREVLRQVKAPLVEQVVDWLALRARRAPQGREAAEALEASTLLNFTRVL